VFDGFYFSKAQGSEGMRMLKIVLMGVFISIFSNLHGDILFPHSCEERTFDRSLYPIAKAREEGFLKVSDLHTLFYAVYGNPDGIPVIILHGGPGGGCDDSMAQFFDLMLSCLIKEEPCDQSLLVVWKKTALNIQ